MPNSSKEYDSYAYFTVTSQRPLAEIEEHLGLEGEHTSWSKGDPRRIPERFRAANPPAPYAFSRWSLASGLEKGQPLDAHLTSLWKRMEPIREEVAALPEDMTGFIQCVARFCDHTHMFALAGGHFRTAISYGLEFDFDFYFDDDFSHEEEGGAPYWKW